MSHENADRIIQFWRSVRERHARIVSFSRPSSAAAVNHTLQGYAESAGGEGSLEAEGAWYGGWWIQVGWEGIKAVSPGDVEEITVGEARCKQEVIGVTATQKICCLHVFPTHLHTFNRDVRVKLNSTGSLFSQVWISPSSALCMVPRGMGRAIQVSISLKGLGKRTIEGAGVTYLPPKVDRYVG